MPDSIFSLNARDRSDFFQAAVARVGRTAILLEKDVWVVWALRALMARCGEIERAANAAR